MTVSSNPRLLFLAALCLALLGAGVAAVILLGLIGLLLLGGAAYLIYQLARFAGRHLASWIESGEEGLRVRLPDGEVQSMSWEEIILGGRASRPKGPPLLFLYAPDQDRFLAVPREYSHLEELEDSLRRHTDFREIELDQKESIEERLKALLAGEE